MRVLLRGTTLHSATRPDRKAEGMKRVAFAMLVMALATARAVGTAMAGPLTTHPPAQKTQTSQGHRAGG